MTDTPKPLVGIIMGSDSDLPVMRAAADVCHDFDVPFEIALISAHRTPDRAVEYARSAKSRGMKVIIAGAGGAAHLAGIIAAMTPLPVIGVPMQTASLGGLDSLLSIVQMPKGVPVATVAIGGAANAALIAIRMLAVNDTTLTDKMVAYQDTIKNQVLEKQARLDLAGYKAYKP